MTITMYCMSCGNSREMDVPAEGPKVPCEACGNYWWQSWKPDVTWPSHQSIMRMTTRPPQRSPIARRKGFRLIQGGRDA